MSEKTLSMRSLVIVGGVICVLDVLLIQLSTFPLVWNTVATGPLLPFSSRYGHTLLGVTALIVFLLALKFHGLKSFRLLLIPVIIFPVSLILEFFVVCGVGECI